MLASTVAAAASGRCSNADQLRPSFGHSVLSRLCLTLEASGVTYVWLCTRMQDPLW
jgi:hypothetical protein